MSTTFSLRTSATLTAAVVLAATILGTWGATPADAARRKPTLVVIGDSMTVFGNNHKGSPQRAWWSYLRARLGVTPVVHAERGSGFGRPGKAADGSGQCLGTSFADRVALPQIKRDLRKARIVIVAGGINDYRQCTFIEETRSWRLTPSDPVEVTRQISLTMDRLAAVRKGKKKQSVYVTAPWGRRESVAGHKGWVTAALKKEATRVGFRYIDTAHGTLYGNRTDDGVHPNKKGSIRLSSHIYRYSDIKRWSVKKKK